MTQKLVYSIFWCDLFSNRQKILLPRWLHSKLISNFKFLSNWKTMFWVISQEQHSIKTQEFTETNSYFYSFTYEKNIFSSSSHQCVVFLRICWQIEKLWIQQQNIFCLLEKQTRLLFFSLHKIQMSKQHRLISYPAEPNLENSSFFALSSIGKNWKVQPRATFKIPVFILCVNWWK